MHLQSLTVYPLNGAILPFKRIVAFYGNFYSTGMGVLGALPPDQMLAKLQAEVKNWEDADSSTPVIPALHYIAVTAQRSPGPAHTYRLRMPFHQIDKALELAKKMNALILDTYIHWIAGQPVQFTGFKLFYKNDILDKRWPTIMQPPEIMNLNPQPVYIQYQ